MKQKLILLGAGGHCKSCIEVIEAEGVYGIAGILDTQNKLGTSILNYPVLGTDEAIDSYIHQNYSFLITVGQIKSSKIRQKLYQMLIQKKASIASIISPRANISRFAQIGQGTIVMHGVHVNANAIIGNNVILNTGSIIEHDVTIGDHVHISTSAVINGNAKIENNCFIGSNAVVTHGRHVKESTVIGAGSVFIKDFETGGIYVGNPAKMIKGE